MKVNKKALYALAAYYKATNLTSVAPPKERNFLIEAFIPCIEEPFDCKHLCKSLMHGEVFFRSIKNDDTYTHKFNDANIAKLLRYIAAHSKFPRNNSLRYV